MHRTHHCGELTKEHVSQTVSIGGWVQSRRDHGGFIFLDIRDRYGVTQVTFDPMEAEAFAAADKVRSESMIIVSGEVVARPENMVNAKISTGEIEIAAKKVEAISYAKTPPFELDKADDVDEELRLRYRFLDLRREKMQRNLKFRNEVLTFIRNYLSKKDFIEVETPLLTASSPEGARDYLVPSRKHQGKFYALPQAPQMYKQLLMVGGLDRYFQIAPCFRDEDARADRSPGEFYQLDLEMSFVEKEDIFELMEPMLIELTEKVAGKKVLSKPFPRITYRDAMEKYGSDKPDLRFGMELVDVTKLAKKSSFQVFLSGSAIKGLKVEGGAKYSRKDIDDLIEVAQGFGAKGLAWVKIKDGAFESQIAKFFDDALQKELISAFNAEDGDFICFVSDDRDAANDILGNLRNHFAQLENLVDPNILAFAWVIDFPFFEKDKTTGKIDFGHNPFSMPQGGMDSLDAEDPYSIVAEQYDIVCNGHELSSGAIRNGNIGLLEKAFGIVGYTKEQFWDEFGNFARAFEFGAPPHGGIAPGIERLLMLLLGEKNIREVMAFPMNQKAEDLVLGAPAIVKPEQLAELGLEIKKNEK